MVEPLYSVRQASAKLRMPVDKVRSWAAYNVARVSGRFIFTGSDLERLGASRALVYRAQRSRHNPMLLAWLLRRLIDDHGYTQELLGHATDRSRAAITSTLSLLRLPAPVRDSISNGDLTSGHGRALARLRNDTCCALASRVAREKLSVRETERLVRDEKARL